MRYGWLDGRWSDRQRDWSADGCGAGRHALARSAAVGLGHGLCFKGAQPLTLADPVTLSTDQSSGGVRYQDGVAVSAIRVLGKAHQPTVGPTVTVNALDVSELLSGMQPEHRTNGRLAQRRLCWRTAPQHRRLSADLRRHARPGGRSRASAKLADRPSSVRRNAEARTVPGLGGRSRAGRVPPYCCRTALPGRSGPTLLPRNRSSAWTGSWDARR